MLAGRIGVPGVQELALDREQLTLVPALLHDEVHSTLGSTLVVQALLVAASPASVAPAQQAWLRAQWDDDLERQFVAILAQVRAQPRNTYLTLVELALPALAQLSPAQYQRFMGQLQHLIQMDTNITLFEWCLYRILKAHLDPRAASSGSSGTLARNREACQVLLSALARAGHADSAEAAASCAAGLAVLGQDAAIDSSLLAPAASGLQALDAAVSRLRRLAPRARERLLDALVACVQRDGHVGLEEGELLRAVCAVLDCPVPPLDSA